VDSELRILKRVQHTCKYEGSEEKEGRFRERIPTFNSERQILSGLFWRNQGECNTERVSRFNSEPHASRAWERLIHKGTMFPTFNSERHVLIVMCKIHKGTMFPTFNSERHVLVMRAEYIREQSSPRSTLNAMYWWCV